MDYKKFLIVRLDKVGDVVLSTPVIKALRDARPDAYIAFMVEDYAGDVIKGNPYLDQVIVYHKNDEGKSLVGNLNFINKLRSFRFDAALILHPTSRSHLLVFLAGIPVRIGYNRKSPFLLTRKIPHTKQLGEKHEAEYALDMLREIGVEPKECKLHVPLHKTSEEKITYIFKQNEIKKKDVVITLHPGASCPSKRWPPQNFVKVADHLTERHKARIVIIAGPDDKATGDEVARAMKEKPLNLSGITTVGDLASILVRSKLFISNDSGPVHIASAVGTPSVVIFGRKDAGLSPKRWGPTGERDIVLHKDAGCPKCLAHECKVGFKCLEAITPDEVIAAAEQLLAQ